MDTAIFNEIKRKRLVQSILKLYRTKKLEIDQLLHDIMLIEVGEGNPPPTYKKGLYGPYDLHIPIDKISDFKPHLMRYMMNMNERILLALFGYKQFENYKIYTRRVK